MPFDTLIEKIVQTQNPTVAGLDPSLEKLPAHLLREAEAAHGPGVEGAAAAVLAFNKGILDALCDIVPAVKPQCAYYELLGWQGMRALSETIAYAKEKGLFVITDGKRGDIGTTMEAYAAAHLGKARFGDEAFEPFGADALTVNGYLGTDGIAPLVAICRETQKGFFVLVKTSNPSAGELQEQTLEGGAAVFETMGDFCERWGERLPGKYGYSGAGAVVGATWPRQLAELRARLPHTFFLVPGYGAQGGGAKDVAGGFDQNGLGAVVNASRSLLYAYRKEGSDGRDFAAAARREAIRMRDALRAALPGGFRLPEN